MTLCIVFNRNYTIRSAINEHFNIDDGTCTSDITSDEEAEM